MFGTSPGPLSGLNHWTMPFKPAGYEKVAHHMKALPKEWNQVPIFIHVAGASYNKDLIPPEKAPRSIYDLLKPEYKGKIISRTPWLGSNNIVHMASIHAWFGGSEEKWADYWTKFKANVDGTSRSGDSSMPRWGSRSFLWASSPCRTRRSPSAEAILGLATRPSGSRPSGGPT